MQVKQILANMPILSGTEVYKTNERTVYRIMLEQYATNDGVLSANQIMDLDNIAVQCPITGGDAVLQARLLLQQQSEALDFLTKVDTQIRLSSSINFFSSRPKLIDRKTD